jgi:hypothetical protein
VGVGARARARARGVAEVVWNGEQWWIKTGARPVAFRLDPLTPNEVSRWWEAVVPVAWTPARDLIVRRPDLAREGVVAGMRFHFDGVVEDFRAEPIEAR